MAEPFLIGDTMTGGYGAGPDILHDCTVAVNPGEIAVIVGPNGAGKSTAMKAVFGMLNVREGAVRLGGEDITALSPQDRVAKGMGFVPQTSNIFTSMSVEENLEMGAFIRRDDISETMAQVYDLFPILREKRRQPAGELSGGQRQQVAVGRALMTKPKVLMLDEPTAGVSPIVMDELFDRIIEVARTGIPILMVEQNARQALEIADRGYVLVQGRNAYTGTGKELLRTRRSGGLFWGGKGSLSIFETMKTLAVLFWAGAASAQTYCSFETECFEADGCSDAAFLFEFLDGGAPESTRLSQGVQATTEFGDLGGYVLSRSEGLARYAFEGPGAMYFLSIESAAARLSVHMEGPMVVTYLGSCE